MTKYVKTPFEDLEEGMMVKHPKGKEARTGTIIDIQQDKENVSILVRWKEGGVSSAMKPNQFEILAGQS